MIETLPLAQNIPQDVISACLHQWAVDDSLCSRDYKQLDANCKEEGHNFWMGIFSITTNAMFTLLYICPLSWNFNSLSCSRYCLSRFVVCRQLRPNYGLLSAAETKVYCWIHWWAGIKYQCKRQFNHLKVLHGMLRKKEFHYVVNFKPIKLFINFVIMI